LSDFIPCSYFEAVARKSGVSRTPLIAIVDDDASVCEAIQGLVEASGFAAEAFSSAEEFLQSERLTEAACLITDVQLPGLSGFQLQNCLSELGSRIPTLVITAFPEDDRRALAGGAICFLRKPVIKEDLLTCIRLALDQRRGGDFR
jgi:FixJ family two-component response regulator